VVTTLTEYLEDRQAFLECVFDAIQGGIVILDREFEIVRVNGWVERKYASDAPLPGKKCHAVFRGINDVCSECSLITSLETGKPFLEIVPHPSSEEPTEWFELSFNRLEDADSRIVGFIMHIRDITERKHALDLLNDEVVRRRLLVDQSRDGIVVLDDDGRVQEANQKYAQMLGYSLAEVHQLHVSDWDMTWTREQLMGMIREVDEKGDHFETVHRRKDGSTYDVEISTNGAVCGGRKLVFCVCRDITERKHAEKEREQLIRELQEALKEIKTLRGILPLCCFCKKIRDDRGYWEQVDVYISQHSQVDISHSICPECMAVHYPGIGSHQE
jgi:PAS domain S-box-containing protein